MQQKEWKPKHQIMWNKPGNSRKSRIAHVAFHMWEPQNVTHIIEFSLIACGKVTGDRAWIDRNEI